MPFALRKVGDQKAALKTLAEVTARGILSPFVHQAARIITNDCPARNDECELQAIYDAVKHGHPRIPGLTRGLRYVSDPQLADWFSGAERSLKMCKIGACGGDCDDHAGLVAALAGSVGFRVGLRAWGPGRAGELVHVYAVAWLPKHGRGQPVGMDTTVADADLGWEPPNGHTLTAEVLLKD